MTESTTPIFEFQNEEIETAKLEYQRALNLPWIQRKRGVPHDWILAPLVLLGFGIPLLLFFTQFIYLGRPWSNLIVLVLCGLAYFFIGWLPEQIYGTNTLTTRHVLWKYPGIRRPIHSFREQGEKFRKHLPVHIIDGRKYFMVNYYRPDEVRKYGFQKRIGIVLLNEAMQVVDNAELFEKAFLVENLSFVIAVEEVKKDIGYVGNKHRITKILKQCEKILMPYKHRWEQLGIGLLWDRLMSSFPVLHAAMEESSVVMGPVHEALRKALGYSFALEFHYEDALHLDEIQKAFVRYMTAAYKIPLLTAKANGSKMIVSIITDQKRGDRKVLLALEKMRVIEEGVLSIVGRFEGEGVVMKDDWEYYHRKVELAKKIGWPIASE